MEPSELKEILQVKFPREILSWEEKNPRRLYLEIAPPALREMAGALFGELGFRFNTASGVQTPAGFQVLYHFSRDETGLILSLRVRLGEAEPEVDSIADLVPAADWIEREIHELLGIAIRGRPEPERLLLSEDWPEGVFPLRKDTDST